jgi:predicted DNA-binding transcriptional regulator AlpA
MDKTEYVDTPRLALHTGIAASTWNKRRGTGDTPPFMKIGSRVLYRLADVDKWMEARARNSTSDS